VIGHSRPEADPGEGSRPPLKPTKVTLFTTILYNAAVTPEQQQGW